ncbi:MAG: type III pantothenate kinase [Cyclobacteriaceae bacterium]
MNIAVDIGNTLIKVGLFNENELTNVIHYENIETLIESGLSGDYWVFSSVKGDSIIQYLEHQPFLKVSHNSSMPIKLNYKTPETLGVDRFTAAIGASEIFPKQNLLIIDFGTCITYDILTKHGVYEGGVIAPGLKMRQVSMHRYTHQLPDISNNWQGFSDALPGKSTGDCLFHGSYTAILMEANGFIAHFKKDYEKLVVIITGGDSSHFESKLKAPIFADPNLVLKGLNKILIHNKLDD